MSPIGHGATAASVHAVIPDLPEPIPERIVHGYLNDELAGECLRAGLFFTPLCRWCKSPFDSDAIAYFLCMACDDVFEQPNETATFNDATRPG